MSVPFDEMSLPFEALVAFARESIRSEGDRSVGIYQVLEELKDKLGDRFPVSRGMYKLLELIEALWADPYIDQGLNTGFIEFAWNEQGVIDETLPTDATLYDRLIARARQEGR